MNHRDSFHADKYTVETKAIEVNISKNQEISEEKAIAIGEELGIKDKFRRHRVKKDELSISYEKNDVEIDLKMIHENQASQDAKLDKLAVGMAYLQGKAESDSKIVEVLEKVSKLLSL